MSFTCGHTPGCGVVCSECSPVQSFDNLARYPMPISLTHPCLDCLALAKVLRDQLKELGELGNNQSIFGRMWNLGCDLDAFLKEREK